MVTGGFSLSTVRSLPRSNRGACRLPYGDLCKSYTRSFGSVQQYVEEIADPDRYRPDHCPQCEAHRPLTRTASTAARWWMPRSTARAQVSVPLL
jgi:hypothetical protein